MRTHHKGAGLLRPYKPRRGPAATFVPINKIAMGIAPRLRADLLSELRGQTLEIRGLGKAFASWQFAINPHVEEVRERVQTTLSQ